MLSWCRHQHLECRYHREKDYTTQSSSIMQYGIFRANVWKRCVALKCMCYMDAIKTCLSCTFHQSHNIHSSIFQMATPMVMHPLMQYRVIMSSITMTPNCILWEEMHKFTKITPPSNILTHKVSEVLSKEFHKALPWQVLLSIRCHLAHSDNETMSKTCPVIPAITDMR